MILGKIWDSEYPWDVRVEKVCRTLVQAGHEVHLVCRNRRGDPLHEVHEGVNLHRMPPLAPALNRWDAGLSFPAFVNPRWRRLAEDTFRTAGVDAIICRDLPLAPMALAVGRKLQRPVIVDVAEHYPGLLSDLYNRQDFKLANLLVRNPVLAGLMERWALPRADGIWVVVDEMAERLVQLGVHPDRITLVSNTPLPERVERMAAIAHPPGPPGCLRLVYLGKVERSRGLHVAIEAVALLKGDTIRVTLDVYGNGSSLEHDKRLADQLGATDRVTFHGHRPYDDVLNQLGTYDAGIVPHHATDHWNWTIQNKFFDYMAAGLPIIASSMPPASRLLGETGAGLTFADRDTHDLAKQIRYLGVSERREDMGRAGKRAVATTCCWTNDAKRLLQSLRFH